jgi:hypothetical protein
MKAGEERTFSHEDSGQTMRVRYEARQAHGDNGEPAKGYTVGYYDVSGPGEHDYKSFRHSPHGPTLMGAKPYAAEQAERHITSTFLKGREVHPRNGRLGMPTYRAANDNTHQSEMG